MQIRILATDPAVGDIIRCESQLDEVYYANGASFELVMLAPKVAPVTQTNEGPLIWAQDSDFITDMTAGGTAVLDADNTSYIMPKTALLGWRCTATTPGGVLGLQYDA